MSTTSVSAYVPTSQKFLISGLSKELDVFSGGDGGLQDQLQTCGDCYHMQRSAHCHVMFIQSHGNYFSVGKGFVNRSFSDCHMTVM